MNKTPTGNFNPRNPAGAASAFNRAFAPQQSARVRSTAESTGGKIAGLTFSVCLCIVLIMLTVKLGVVLFT